MGLNNGINVTKKAIKSRIVNNIFDFIIGLTALKNAVKNTDNSDVIIIRVNIFFFLITLHKPFRRLFQFCPDKKVIQLSVEVSIRRFP